MKSKIEKLDNKIVIVGAGLTGSLLALMLAQKGFRVDIYEKRGDIREYKPRKKRSLGMSLSNRGRMALENANVLHKLEPSMASKHGRATHNANGNVKFQIYGNGNQTLSTVNRKNINSVLIDEAIDTGLVHFHFNQKLSSVDLENNLITFENSDTLEELEVEYSYLFGADGANSNVREVLSENNVLVSERKRLYHVYKEMTIPMGDDGNYVLDPNFVHIWSAPDTVFVALPSVDKSFISTIFYRNGDDGELKNVKNKEELNNYFEKHLPNLHKILPDLEEDFFGNPDSEIFEIKCSQWNYKNRVLLIGDSAHAFAPFYAMGMNTCFEDCNLFMKTLMENEFDFGDAIVEFANTRKKDLDAMQFLTNRNYQNLQFCKQPIFDLKWKLERKIWEEYPDLYVPEYCLVAFSEIPFSEIVKISEKNMELIEEIYSLYLEQIVNETPEIDMNLFVEKEEVKRILLNREESKEYQKVFS